MSLYIVKRILQIVVVLFIASIIIFFVIRLAPGDPALYQLGMTASDPRHADMLEAMREKMGLDKPIVVQYGLWLGRVVKLDFGVSARSGELVIDEIKRTMPATIELMIGGVSIGLVFSFIFGISSALKHKSLWDRFVQMISQVGLAIPVFWLGLLLIILFSLKLNILPPSGRISFLENPLENIRFLIMPAMVLSVYRIAVYSRFLRSETLEVMRQDYVKVARSKGLPRRVIITRHIVKNSLIPFVTIFGMDLGSMLGNTVVIEQVFGWPGIGWLLFNAITNRDYALVQGIIFVIAFVYAALNLIVDIAYIYLNPRIIYTKAE